MGLFKWSKKRKVSGAKAPSTPASAASSSSSSTDPHAVSTPASSSENSSILSPTTEKRAAQAAEPLAALVQALKQKVEAEHAKGPVDNARKRALYYEVRTEERTGPQPNPTRPDRHNQPTNRSPITHIHT